MSEGQSSVTDGVRNSGYLLGWRMLERSSGWGGFTRRAGKNVNGRAIQQQMPTGLYEKMLHVFKSPDELSFPSIMPNQHFSTSLAHFPLSSRTKSKPSILAL